jgi:hypothetical protein
VLLARRLIGQKFLAEKGQSDWQKNPCFIWNSSCFFWQFGLFGFILLLGGVGAREDEGVAAQTQADRAVMWLSHQQLPLVNSHQPTFCVFLHPDMHQTGSSRDFGFRTPPRACVCVCLLCAQDVGGKKAHRFLGLATCCTFLIGSFFVLRSLCQHRLEDENMGQETTSRPMQKASSATFQANNTKQGQSRDGRSALRNISNQTFFPEDATHAKKVGGGGPRVALPSFYNTTPLCFVYLAFCSSGHDVRATTPHTDQNSKHRSKHGHRRF